MVTTNYHTYNDSCSMSVKDLTDLPAGVSRIRTVSRFMSTTAVTGRFDFTAVSVVLTQNNGTYYWPAKITICSDNYSGKFYTLIVEFEVPQIGALSVLDARFVCPELQGLSITTTNMFFYKGGAWVPFNLV